MGNGNKAEMLIAVCAVISSIAAVYIAWDQARVMRSQEKADVWPILQLTHQTDSSDTNSYTFHIQNAGVGPALIEDYLIRIPGQPDTKNLRDMVRYFLPVDALGEPVFANANLSGRVLRQGAELEPVAAIFPEGEETAEIMQTRISEFVSGESKPAEAFICFCSILDDCWIASTMPDNPRPLEVKSCTQLKETADRLLPPTPLTPAPKEHVQ
jgi:hypothetical protein